MATTSAPTIQSGIRRHLRNAPGLTVALQSSRAVLHFGPWRHAARAVIRRSRPPQHYTTADVPTPLQLEVSALVQTLCTNGLAVANPLPPDVLRRVRAVTDDIPPGEYGNFHDHQPDIRAMLQSPNVLEVVRGYLGAEPELLGCTLVVHHPEDPQRRPIHLQRHFHFDYAGWHSLSLFVYLTDVLDESGAHQTVVGTHRRRKMRDAIRPWVPDEEIMERYADRIQTITGPAGTMFFEDTEAFHRRLIMKRRRVMLNILYSSHRSWLSEGRLVPRYADYLRASSGTS